jgi:PBS lyase HEAT-like repeat-containing protein
VSLLEKEDQRVAAELRAVGIKVDSVYDLVNSRRSYKEAIPALVRVLPSVQDTRIKEGVVRALAVKEAIGEDVARAMIREFEAIDPSAQPSEQALKWAIADTLSVVARDPVFEKVTALVRDKQHGKAREMLAEALANMKDPRAVDVLVELLDDDQIAGHAIVALGKLKARAAEPAIERFLDHPKAWIRKEAKRALAKIQNAG